MNLVEYEFVLGVKFQYQTLQYVIIRTAYKSNLIKIPEYKIFFFFFSFSKLELLELDVELLA
jgi:hypothetical protein